MTPERLDEIEASARNLLASSRSKGTIQDTATFLQTDVLELVAAMRATFEKKSKKDKK